MFWPTVFMSVIALIMLFVGGHRGLLRPGLHASFKLGTEIFPLLIMAFIIAGMMQVLLPADRISRWVGDNSGFRGLCLSSVAGALTPGGPYVSMPIALGFVRAGAGIGPVVAYLTAWSLWAFLRLPIEIGILGWRITGIRLLSVLIFPLLAGLIAQGLANVFPSG